MEFVTTEVVDRLIRSSGLSGDVAELTGEVRDSGIGKAENYCSDIVRIKLNLKLRTGRTLTKDLVLKVFLENLEGDALAEMKRFFANEVTMYDKILNRLVSLAEKHGLKHPRLWPNCYFASTDVVILDDLKEEGFQVAPRHNGLKLEDAVQVMMYLGRLHALSIVAEKRNLIEPSVIRKPYTFVSLDSLISKLIKKCFSVVSDIVVNWGDEWEEPGRKIGEYSDKMSGMINRLYHEDVPMRVVNHGDAWINNILFMYDHAGQAQSLRFVDFQNALYNSYGWDLIYFLYTSLKGDIMRANYDGLINSYRDEFLLSLKQMGEPIDLAPSVEEVKQDVLRLLPFCLTMSCTTAGVVCNASDEPMQIDDLVNDEVKLRLMFANPVWSSTMKSHIKYYQEHHLL